MDWMRLSTASDGTKLEYEPTFKSPGRKKRDDKIWVTMILFSGHKRITHILPAIVIGPAAPLTQNSKQCQKSQCGMFHPLNFFFFGFKGTLDRSATGVERIVKFSVFLGIGTIATEKYKSELRTIAVDPLWVFLITTITHHLCFYIALVCKGGECGALGQ